MDMKIAVIDGNINFSDFTIERHATILQNGRRVSTPFGYALPWPYECINGIMIGRWLYKLSTNVTVRCASYDVQRQKMYTVCDN